MFERAYQEYLRKTNKLQIGRKDVCIAPTSRRISIMGFNLCATFQRSYEALHLLLVKSYYGTVAISGSG